MDASPDNSPRPWHIALPSRGGEMAGLEFGPPDRPVDIIFSHANGFNAGTYRSILQSLGAGLRLLALDLRGHGASRLPLQIEGRDGWKDFCDDLLAVLDALAQRPVVLAGHSMGGSVSLMAAAAAPERVKALVLLETVIWDVKAMAHLRSDRGAVDSPIAKGAERRRATFPNRAAALESYRGRGAFKTWTETQLVDYVNAGFRPTETGEITLTCPPEWEAANFRASNNDLGSALAQTRCPVHILRAEHGFTYKIDPKAAALDGEIRIKAETVPGTTHFLPMERPDVVHQALTDAAQS